MYNSAIHLHKIHWLPKLVFFKITTVFSRKHQFLSDETPRDKNFFLKLSNMVQPGTESWDHCFKSSQQNPQDGCGAWDQIRQTDMTNTLNKMGKHLTQHKAHLSHSSFLVLGESNARISLPRKWKSDAEALISHPAWQKNHWPVLNVWCTYCKRFTVPTYNKKKPTKANKKKEPQNHMAI